MLVNLSKSQYNFLKHDLEDLKEMSGGALEDRKKSLGLECSNRDIRLTHGEDYDSYYYSRLLKCAEELEQKLDSGLNPRALKVVHENGDYKLRIYEGEKTISEIKCYSEEIFDTFKMLFASN